MPTAVTVPSGTERHEAYTGKHPAGNMTATSERCGCTQGASTSLLYRNTSLSFCLHSLTWHPQPAVSVTRTWNRQGHIVVPQMRGDALATGIKRWENTVPSLISAEADLPDLCKNLHLNSENYKCIWASWRHLPHHQGPGSGKYMQKTLSPLQSARAVTWIWEERHKRGPLLIFAPKVLLTSNPAEHLFNGNGWWSMKAGGIYFSMQFINKKL